MPIELPALLSYLRHAKSAWGLIKRFIDGDDPKGTQAISAAYLRAVDQVISAVPTSQRNALRAGLLDNIVKDQFCGIARGRRQRPDIDQIRKRLVDHPALIGNISGLVHKLERAFRQALAEDPDAASVVNLATSGFLESERPTLNLQPSTVARYSPMEGLAAILGSSMAAKVEVQTQVLMERANAELQTLHKLWIEGRSEDVLCELEAYEHDTKRQIADPPEARARFSRFHAAVVLSEQHDPDRAEALLKTARALDPSGDDTTHRSLVAHQRGENDLALRLLASRTRPNLDLAAAIHLSAERLDDAAYLLALEDTGSLAPTAETYRLRAAVALGFGNLEDASRAIDNSLARQPNAFEARFLRARVAYARGLSPALKHQATQIWPTTVDPRLVRDDAAARDSLASAAAQFAALAELLPEAPACRLRTWQAAALLALDEKYDEGATILQRLIANDPTEPVPVLWALSRNVAFDLSVAAAALDAAGPAADAGQVAALCHIHLASGDTDRASAVVRAALERGDIGPDGLLRVCEAKILCAEGQLDTAIGIAELLPATRRWLVEVFVAHRSAEIEGDTEKLLVRLTEAYAATGDPSYLLDSAQAAARIGRWDWVAESVLPRVSALAVSHAIHLAATALLHLRRAPDALELLDVQLATRVDEPAEVGLRTLRARALAAVGRPGEAAVELEWVTQRRGDTSTLLFLAQCFVDKGDLRALLPVANRLAGRSDIPPRPAITLAGVVGQQNVELARRFWRGAALAPDLPDDAVGPAYSTGIQLGLDRETAPLVERMRRLAEERRGGIQAVTIEELQGLHSEWTQAVQEVLVSYAQGATPIHAVAAILREPLSHLLHSVPQLNEDDLNLLTQFGPRIRHGGRTHPLEFASATRLRVDTSTLLVAHHLELLPLIEKAFAPIRLPHGISQLLLRMEEARTHHQPSRLEAYRELRRLLSAGTIRSVSSDASGADGSTETAVDGAREYHVVFATSREEGESAGLNWTQVTVRAVIASLVRQGPFTHEEEVRSLERLGVEGRDSGSESPIPSQGSLLHFTHGTLELLVGTPALREVCSRFDVTVDESEAVGWALALEGAEGAGRDARWVAELRERISRGMDEGVYALVPDRYAPSEPSNIEKSTPAPELRGLWEIVSAEAQEHEITCIDDRSIARLLLERGFLVADILDIMDALHGRGDLSETGYYERLTQLRSGNFRYLPVSANEIVHHLCAAVVRDGALVESRALGVLRRYVAACLLDHDLQRPDLEQGNPGEAPLVLAIMASVEDALVQLWSDAESPVEATTARAEWLVVNLYQDISLARAAIISASPPDPGIAALGQVMVLMRALSLVASDFIKETSLASSFMQWTFDRIIEPRLRGNPAMSSLLGYQLAGRIYELSFPVGPEVSEEFAIGLAHLFFSALPEPLRLCIEDEALLQRLGVRIVRSIRIGEVTFALDDFAEAAAAAMRGQTRLLEELEPPQEQFVFLPTDPPGGFRFVDPRGRVEQPQATAFALLSPDADRHISALSELRARLDMSDEHFTTFVSRVTELDSPAQRLQEFEKALERSMNPFYQELDRKVRVGEEIAYADLLPANAGAVLDHLRINEDDFETFPPAWAAAMARALTELPLDAVLGRCLGLPLPPPPVVLDHIGALTPSALRDILRHRARVRRSPVSAIGSLFLLVHLGRTRPSFARLARRFATSIASPDYLAESEAFGKVLGWLEDELRDAVGFAECLPEVQLAVTWYHAHRLYVTFRGAGATPDAVATYFGHRRGRISKRYFDRAAFSWNDRAHPRHYVGARFLLEGVAEADRETGILSDARVRTSATALALQPREEGDPQPRLSLYRDLSRMGNALGAYFSASPRALENLLGQDLAAGFTPNALTTAIQDAAAKVAANPMEFSGWFVLAAVLGDNAADTSVADSIQNAIREVDFAALVQHNPDLGMFALRVSASQLAHSGTTEDRERTQEMLVRIALAEPTLPGQLRPAPHDDDIFEAAARLSFTHRDVRDSVTELARRLDTLIQACPRMGLTALDAIERLWWEFPLDLASQFTRLLLHLRATCPPRPSHFDMAKTEPKTVASSAGQGN